MSVQKSIDKAWNAYEILLFSLCHPPSFMLFWCVFDSYGFGAFLVLNWCGFQSRIDKASKQPQKCTNIGWKTAWITEDDIMNTVRFHKCFRLYLCYFCSIRIWCAFGALSMLVCLFVRLLFQIYLHGTKWIQIHPISLVDALKWERIDKWCEIH